MTDTYKTVALGKETASGSGGLANHTAAMATLVADGASPTQAHVTAANAALMALLGGSASQNAALLVWVDTTVYPTLSAVRTALAQAVQQLGCQGMIN